MKSVNSFTKYCVAARLSFITKKNSKMPSDDIPLFN